MDAHTISGYTILIALILRFGPLSCDDGGVGDAVISAAEAARRAYLIQKPAVYEPVARRLALYCQSDQRWFPETLSSEWLPNELTRKFDGSAEVSGSEAHVFLSYSFANLMYTLSLDTHKSDANTNAWNLYFRAGAGKGELLTTLHLAKHEQLSSSEILNIVIEGYDASIAQDPKNEYFHCYRIRTYLRFDAIFKARDACRTLLTIISDDRWTVFANAILEGWYGSPSKGERLMREWVDKDRNYYRILDLSYYYRLTNRPTKAIEAIEKAANFDRNRWNHSCDQECRGYTCAMYAYNLGYYAAAEKLARTLIETGDKNHYTQRGLRRLLDAALKAGKGEAVPVEWDDAIAPYNPLVQEGLGWLVEPDLMSTNEVEKLLGRDLDLRSGNSNR
jgi:tetratricopeptide (TPR) repeat protein